MAFGLLTLAAPWAWAQQASVRGFVTDAVSEQALQGTTVALQQGDRLLGTATDGDGYFILNRIPAGQYTLRITFIGYTPYEETLDLAGQVVQRSVALQPQEAALDEVVVEADREGGVTTVAAGLQTVEAAQIERVPVPGVTGDLAGYLQTMPGIVVQGDRGGQFFVRGGAVDQNLALIDGLPVYMPFHVLSFYSAFPEEIINDAAVYTGGYGARYGSRLSSMIDVRTRNGNKQNLAGTVSLAPFLSTVRVEGPLVKDRVSVIASVRESLLEQAMPDLFGQRFPYRFGDRFAKLHAFLGPQHSFSVTALQTTDRGDLAGSSQTFQGEAQERIVSDSSEVAWDNRALGGRYVYRSNALPVLAEVVAGYADMSNAFGPPERRERTASIESLDLAGHLTYFLRRAEVRAGATYRTSTLSFALGGQFQDLTTDRQDVTEVMAYLEGELRLGDGEAVRLQPGLHLYALPDRSQQWLEPRLRATWQSPTGRHRVGLAGGVYHQAIVGLNDERDVGNLFTAWTLVPEDAPTPSALHGLLSWNVQLLPGLTAAAEGFYKGFSNLSVPVFSAFPSFTTALQPADGQAYGLDVRLETARRPTPYDAVLDGYISYALSWVEYETAQFTYTPSHDRRHQFNALLHAARGELGVTAQFQYGTGLPFTPSGGFDVWHLFTPNVDVAADPGTDRVLYGTPFSHRQPTYQRLDLWVERRSEQGRYVVTLRAGALNVFNRKNLFYFDLFTLKRVDQFPVVPSIGLKIELR